MCICFSVNYSCTRYHQLNMNSKCKRNIWKQNMRDKVSSKVDEQHNSFESRSSFMNYFKLNFTWIFQILVIYFQWEGGNQNQCLIDSKNEKKTNEKTI